MNRNLSLVIFIWCFTSWAFAGESSPLPNRIVSLAPSTTELLFALGLGDHVVGVTSYCDYPEAAKAKPKIGGMSNPSLEAVVSQKPDIVVMSTDGNPQEFEERLRSLNIRTYIFTARRLAELPQGLREMGAILGVEDRAETIAEEIERTFMSLRARVTSRQGSQAHAKKVIFIVWPDPLIVAGPGTAMNDAILMFGQRNIAEKATIAYPKYSLEEVIRQSPDVIVIGKASGMDMRAVSQGFLRRMASVPAVKNGNVCYVGDNLYRLGPRIVNGIKELAECFN
jgi:iron complex transport system substrate-binding protein